jgi:hypothetical protein
MGASQSMLSWLENDVRGNAMGLEALDGVSPEPPMPYEKGLKFVPQAADHLLIQPALKGRGQDPGG